MKSPEKSAHDVLIQYAVWLESRCGHVTEGVEYCMCEEAKAIRDLLSQVGTLRAKYLKLYDELDELKELVRKLHGTTESGTPN